ncbi:MAG: hypothetical protein HWN81_00255 [Candidatus Lokiarchaeota archaeon]|nr:hypothetical protein [Candidatus Lokiarchaeota archaeon]
MGYTTDFHGKFKLNKTLDNDTKVYLTRFNETRRMAFNVDSKYGIDGEFYVGHHWDFSGCFAGQVDRSYSGLMSYNCPPSTQPGLWCQWTPSDCGNYIEWDGGEKFYNYVEWLQYIIDNFLKPKGYSLTGDVHWQGESSNDMGVIVVQNNAVKTMDVNEHRKIKEVDAAVNGIINPEAEEIAQEDLEAAAAFYDNLKSGEFYE